MKIRLSVAFVVLSIIIAVLVPVQPAAAQRITVVDSARAGSPRYVGGAAEKIPADHVTLATLQRIITESDNFKVIPGSGDETSFAVKSLFGNKVIVTIRPNIQLINYTLLTRFSKDASRLQKLEFVNNMNNRAPYLRFSMLRDDVMCIDFPVPYDEGLDVAQMLASLSNFNLTIFAVIQPDTKILE